MTPQEFTIHWNFNGDINEVKEFRIFKENGKLLGIKSDVNDFSFTVKDRSNADVNVDINPGTTYTLYVRVKYKNDVKLDSNLESF